jgi:hypothetical protein
LQKKRKVGKDWRRFRTAETERIRNTATQELKQLLKTYNNDGIQTFLQGLTPTDSTCYSPWKLTKKIKQTTKSSPLETAEGTWAHTPMRLHGIMLN